MAIFNEVQQGGDLEARTRDVLPATLLYISADRYPELMDCITVGFDPKTDEFPEGLFIQPLADIRYLAIRSDQQDIDNQTQAIERLEKFGQENRSAKLWIEQQIGTLGLQFID